MLYKNKDKNHISIDFLMKENSLENQIKLFNTTSSVDKIFTSKDEFYDFFYKRNLCSINTLNSTLANCAAPTKTFLEFHELYYQNIKFLDNFDIFQNEIVAVYCYRTILSIFKPVTIYFLENILSSRYTSKFSLELKENEILYISFIILIITMDYCSLVKFSRFLLTKMQIVHKIFEMIPLKNTEDVEVIDRFLNQTENK